MKRLPHFGALVLALACAPGIWAAGHKQRSEAQQRYNEERAHCLSGRSHQDRSTCLREAGAVLRASRRNALETGSANFQGNATARCNAQPAADRDACVQRIIGGSVQGSVEGGGLIRQVETPVK